MWLEWLSHTLSASMRSRPADPRRHSAMAVDVGMDERAPPAEAVPSAAAALRPRKLEIAGSDGG